VFAARLVQLQGIDENDYAALAIEKNAATVTLEALRGSVYDRNGVALAESADASKLVADPTFTTGYATQIATALHERLGVDYIEALARLRKPDTRYVELARHLDPERAADMMAYLAENTLPGVYVAEDTTRRYPARDVAANLIGFVGDANTGLSGLEVSHDSTLAGTNGSATFQLADGQQIPLADHTVEEPRDGTSMRLTIDQDLQFLAQRRLGQAVESSGGASGTAVVMDVKTGELLALADYPTFNPNHYKDYPESSYRTRSVQDIYEPGSVEKVLTFAALIDGGYVTPRTRITVPATLPRSTTTINDYFDHPTLRLTAAGALVKSSNIGTVLAAERMPSAELFEYLRSFGFGSPTGIGVPGEGAGLLPAPEEWEQITHDTIAFGQGLSVNAVQMAAAIAAVANDGVYVQPSLVESYLDASGTVTQADPPDTHRVVSARAARAVAHMMEGVVGPEGTAPDAAIDGYRVAGKTGTAQRVGQECGCYRGFTVSFAGFAPADEPRFVVYVVVQKPSNGGGGGSVGGPVFHDLMAAALQKFAVPPTGARQPALPVEW
jgi:cell division protein FtsI (penicillin-binding protein 3)